MNKINLQSGRSMIEMLGVLAIIGVLSVGGIMGYSKAMFRYKINKTIDQITYIAGNIRTTFASQGNYDGLGGNPPIWKKAHIVPDDMWKAGETYPQHAWESNVYVGADAKNSTDTNYNKAFVINYDNIPEEACIELLSYDWSVVGMTNVYSDTSDLSEITARVPMSVSTAGDFCSHVFEGGSIYFNFDQDWEWASDGVTVIE